MYRFREPLSTSKLEEHYGTCDALQCVSTVVARQSTCLWMPIRDARRTTETLKHKRLVVTGDPAQVWGCSVRSLRPWSSMVARRCSLVTCCGAELARMCSSWRTATATVVRNKKGREATGALLMTRVLDTNTDTNIDTRVPEFPCSS